MSQLQMCDFSYTDPWIARNNDFSCKKSFVMCGMKLVTSQQFHSHFTLGKNACTIQILSLDLTCQ